MDKLPDDIIEKINKMKIERELMDEYWIDLHILVSCSHTENGLTVFYYQYNDKLIKPYVSVEYHLRIALRKLGKKIIKHKRMLYFKDLKRFCDTFYTDITEKEYKETMKLYHSYNDKTYEDFCIDEEEEED
jgi:hypothetical protein